MPLSTRGKKRDQRVAVLLNPLFGYVFNTRDLSAEAGVSSADLRNALGHRTTAELAQSSSVVMVSGANAPKPARARKRVTNATNASAPATIETFVGFLNYATAEAAGFQISKRAKTVNLAAPSTVRRQFSVVATLSNGLKCISSADGGAATQGRRETLGLEIASQISSTEAQKLCRGGRSRAGRVQVAMEGGIFATLPFSTAKQADAGGLGSIVDLEYVEYAGGQAQPPSSPAAGS